MHVRLKDGTEVRIRPIRTDDKAVLAAGYGQLSDETIYRRFLAPKPRLSSAELRYLTEVDGTDHVALVATIGRREAIIAVGRFVRDRDDPGTAEFAIVVGDAYQRRGLGRRLAELLAEEARDGGVRRFTATTLSDNVAVRRLIDTIAKHLVHEQKGPVREVVIDLAA